MLLDFIKDFSWYNEPFSLSFDERGMHLTAENNTDFWQAKKQNLKRDSAHFFYTSCSADFTFKLKWNFNDLSDFSQCGLMVRIDSQNWFKVSIMSATNQKHEIGTSLTNDGFSDWAIFPLEQPISQIFYKIKKVQNNFFVYFSLDDSEYKQIRQFAFSNDFEQIKFGAYIACPGRNNCHATIERIEVS